MLPKKPRAHPGTRKLYVTNGKGAQIVISRSGEVLIMDDHGRERERHKVPYGATLIVVAIAVGYVLFLQIGDGDILAVGEDGESVEARLL